METKITTMRLTGKAEKDFFEWYRSTDFKSRNQPGLALFYNYSNSMQYGVYVDFFDSIGIMIELQVHVSPTMQGGSFKCIRPVILSNGRFHNVGASFGLRERARTAAIEKANEIYNLK